MSYETWNPNLEGLDMNRVSLFDVDASAPHRWWKLSEPEVLPYRDLGNNAMKEIGLAAAAMLTAQKLPDLPQTAPYLEALYVYAYQKIETILRGNDQVWSGAILYFEDHLDNSELGSTVKTMINNCKNLLLSS